MVVCFSGVLDNIARFYGVLENKKNDKMLECYDAQ